jgi:hypothetical protein
MGVSVFAAASPADRARLIAAARLVVRYLLSFEDAAGEGEKQASESGPGGTAWPPSPD